MAHRRERARPHRPEAGQRRRRIEGGGARIMRVPDKGLEPVFGGKAFDRPSDQREARPTRRSRGSSTRRAGDDARACAASIVVRRQCAAIDARRGRCRGRRAAIAPAVVRDSSNWTCDKGVESRSKSRRDDAGGRLERAADQRRFFGAIHAVHVQAKLAHQSCVHGVQHSFGVSIYLHVVPASSDLAVRVDEIRRPRDAHVLAAVARLLLPHAVLLGDLVIGVGKQREVHVVLRGELRLAFLVEDAHAEDRGFALLELRQVVAERAGFGGAARRVVLRIEVQHDRLSRRNRTACGSLPS